MRDPWPLDETGYEDITAWDLRVGDSFLSGSEVLEWEQDEASRTVRIVTTGVPHGVLLPADEPVRVRRAARSTH